MSGILVHYIENNAELYANLLQIVFVDLWSLYIIVESQALCVMKWPTADHTVEPLPSFLVQICQVN